MPFIREYLIEEINHFRVLMGTKDFWSSSNKVTSALHALLYLYFHTEELNASDIIAMRAITIEYDRRLVYVLLNDIYMEMKGS